MVDGAQYLRAVARAVMSGEAWFAVVAGASGVIFGESRVTATSFDVCLGLERVLRVGGTRRAYEGVCGGAA